jgi:hypothetical protein
LAKLFHPDKIQERGPPPAGEIRDAFGVTNPLKATKKLLEALSEVQPKEAASLFKSIEPIFKEQVAKFARRGLGLKLQRRKRRRF